MSFILGFITAGAIGTGAVILLVRRLGSAERRRRRARLEADLSSEIIAHGPDGLFVWDHRTRATRASRRLAVLLELPDGTKSGFDDVLGRLPGDQAGLLGKAAVELRGYGTPFDLILSRGERLIQAIGVRVGDGRGETLADVLWMRDATGNPGAEAQAAASAGERAAGDSRFQTLLEALPLPVWLRDAEMNLTFVNRAGVSVAVAEPTRNLAARATAEGKAMSERHLLALGGSPRLIDVTESPLRSGSGTLGFAVDQSEAEEREGEFARAAAAQAQVLESLDTGIAVFDGEGVLKSFNGAYGDLLRLDMGWLDTQPSLSEILDRLRGSRRLPEAADFRAYKDSQLRQVTTLSEPAVTFQHLPDGDTLKVTARPHPLGGVLYVYEDVTELLALERAANTQAAVQRETVVNLFEGVAVIGSDGRLRLANPSFRRLWNLSDEQADAGPHAAALVEHMRPLLPHTPDWQAEKERIAARLLGRLASAGRLERRDGRVLDYANVPLPDGSMLVHYQDAPEQDAALAFSHRARTALTVVIGYAELLKDNPKNRLSKKQKDQCDAIAAAGRLLLADTYRLAGLEVDDLPALPPREGDLFDGV